MTFRSFIILLIALTTTLHATQREWKSEDGTRSIPGRFLKRDVSSITIRRSSDHVDLVIPLTKLHPDDLAWLQANHPAPPPPTEPAAKDTVFDKLSFGDTRDEVFQKLKTSQFVELTTAETFIGRTGLNGVFRTRKKIGGLDISLYFDWSGDGKLKEISLQTTGLPATALEDQLTPCWTELVELLTTLYGKPIVADSTLRIASIKDGTLYPSHLWNLEKKGSATLGAAREGDAYQIVVRFTEQAVKPIGIP